MAQSHILQVVNGDGEFDETRVSDFLASHSINDVGVGYQVVAITGPQSSGKSTLMNAVFGTTFEEMDAISGRRQTTKGIWMAMGPKIQEPRTLLLDLEGSDGRERGEDDNSFERQSSLFALAVADVLLVNMWAKDVGREAGAGKPLLKTIFQVNLKLFTPAPNRRRTVLLFVFRDRTRTPLARLIETWEEDLRSMWASITKPPNYEGCDITDFFEMVYSSLPNFEEREEDFRAESVLLRRRFTDENEDTLVRVSRDKLPGDALALSLQKVWEVIRDQKDLNLPAHKVMVANIRCTEIMEDQLRSLEEDQAWMGLRQDSEAGLVPNFGSRAGALLDSCITGYEQEARYFEDSVRHTKQSELAERAQLLLHSAYTQQLGHLRQNTMRHLNADMVGRDPQQSFSAAAARSRANALSAFQEGVQALAVRGTSWDVRQPVSDIAVEIDAHISKLRAQKLSEVEKEAQKGLASAVGGSAGSLLDSCPPDLWPRLRRLLAASFSKACKKAGVDLEGYDVPEHDTCALFERLDAFARAKVEAAAREAANTALPRMKDRFNDVFSKDETGMLRSWGPRANIPAVNQKAREAASQLLAQLAVLRTDSKQDNGASVVDTAVREQASDKASSSTQDSIAAADTATTSGAGFDMVAAAEWPELPADVVLLSPSQCRTLWRQFSSDSMYAVRQAQATQEANRAASNKWPPFWAIAAMVVLGFDEFVAVLYNPLWLVLALIIFLFGKTVYQELDVDTEMQRGMLPGAMALSAKFVPVVQRVSQKTLEAVKDFVADPKALSEKRAGVEQAALAQMQEKVAHVGASVREHVAPDSHSATTATSTGIAGAQSEVRQRRAGGEVELTEQSASA